jgi:hypothetical protein
MKLRAMNLQPARQCDKHMGMVAEVGRGFQTYFVDETHLSGKWGSALISLASRHLSNTSSSITDRDNAESTGTKQQGRGHHDYQQRGSNTTVPPQIENSTSENLAVNTSNIPTPGWNTEQSSTMTSQQYGFNPFGFYDFSPEHLDQSLMNFHSFDEGTGGTFGGWNDGFL